MNTSSERTRGLRPLARGVTALAIAAGLSASSVVRAGDEGGAGKPGLAANAATARSFAGAFVRVEVALRYDGGDAPSALAAQSDYGTFIQDERPIDAAGIVLAPDRVLMMDPELHPRFVAGLTVVFGAQRVAAVPLAWVADHDGVILALARPLDGVSPPSFDATRPPPYRAVHYGRSADVWTTTVGSVLDRLRIDEDGREWADAWWPAIVIDRSGVPVGVTLADEVPADGAGWKGSPTSWPLVASAERDALVEGAARAAADGLLRVHLRLRSPKSDRSSPTFRFRSRGGDEEEGNDTERNAVGLLVDATKVVVLAGLDAAATARIEGIDVHAADGTRVPAKFLASYRHVGALLVETERALPRPLALAATPIRRHTRDFLLDVRLELQGDKRRTHVTHARLDDYRQGWRRQWSPSVGDSPDGHFVFDRTSALVAFPVARRANEERSRWRRNDGTILMSPEYLVPMIADPAAHADAANVPVVAEREDRLAWLGVETQRLDRELARVNGVSAVTQDGRSGALVSYVYAGSPAQQAGLLPGHILLRLHAPDRPAPIPVGGSGDSDSSFEDYLEAMGGASEMFGSMMSGRPPWPSVDNELNRTLTKIGAGKKIRLEYAVDGQTREVEMTVTEGPPHFDAAPLFKSEPLGVTVRDLTYEVRRHFQLDEAFVGVIVSKVERGGRAAVADLRPMDIVLRIGDEPVAGAAAFGKAIAGDGELRLTVKDKLKERVVKIAAATAESSGAK